MSIRKIEIKVSNITEPKNTERIWAGIQYEDNATEIVFDVSSVNIAKALYRIDFDSNGAGYHPSKNLAVSGGKISRKIPKLITNYGGEAEVAAVITELDSTGKETGTVYSYPVILYFTPVQKSEYGNETVEGNISEMEESVKIMYEATEKNAVTASNAARSALDSKNKTEDARFSLEQGSEFVFVGGNAENTSRVEFVEKKRYLLIGDSYGQGARRQVGVKGWAPIFKEKMGLSDNNCIINTLGGTGFCNGVSKNKDGITIDNGVDASKEYKFIDLLRYTATMTETNDKRELKVSEVFPVSNPETITDIVVCGGYNDMNYSNGEIANAINKFVSKAKELYPNALVSIGMVGCSGETTEAIKTQKLAVNSLSGYAGVSSASKYPYRYLNNVEYVLKLAARYMYEDGISDGIHPTALGYEALANAITKAVKGGFTAGYASYTTLLKPVSGITLLYNPYAVVKINNAITEIHAEPISFVFENGYNLSANELIELAEFDPSTSLITGTYHDPESGVYNRTGFVPVTGHYQCTQEYDGGKFHIYTGKAGFINGKLCLIPLFLNDGNSGFGVNVPIRNLQIHLLHITTATNIY